MGCFSFQTTKPMTAGEGGAITTDDPDLEQRCQSLVNCGRRRPNDTFESPLLGANYRMTEWQCGVLLAQIDRMPGHVTLQRHRAAGPRNPGQSPRAIGSCYSRCAAVAGVRSGLRSRETGSYGSSRHGNNNGHAWGVGTWWLAEHPSRSRVTP